MTKSRRKRRASVQLHTQHNDFPPFSSIRMDDGFPLREEDLDGNQPESQSVSDDDSIHSNLQRLTISPDPEPENNPNDITVS
jgi:hypothetical protein